MAKKTGPFRTKFLGFWREHPNYTAGVHVILGIGLGILYSTYSQAGYVDTVGWVMVLVGVLGHFYAMGA